MPLLKHSVSAQPFKTGRPVLNSARRACRRPDFKVQFSFVCLTAMAISPAAAQPSTAQAQNTEAAETSSSLVVYDPGFFAIYRPVTALEIVLRIPGFQLDEGESLRGFGANAGNVLIDGERPSVKTGTLTDFLRRIPAERVARIEVIRGATGALEARVQGVVVNITLKSDEENARAVSWQAIADYDGGRLTPRGEASFSDKLGAADFTVAAERFATRWRARGSEEFVSSADPQARDEVERGSYEFWSGALAATTQLGRERVLRSNLQVMDEKFATSERSIRTPIAGEPGSVFEQQFDQDELQIEASADLEAGLARDLTGKLVFLFNYKHDEGISRLLVTGPGDSVSENEFAFTDSKGEGVARLELGWSRWKDHKIQFGAEGVWNYLDSEATLTLDGAEIPVDGADTRVTELRTEAFIIDSWSASKRTTVDAGFALEVSTIRQTGDFENERTFVYPKPSLAITHNLPARFQLRLRGERQVAQLDFAEFVSATNFDDNDIDFGNPELQPERTWNLQASVEKRFGEFGVFTVSAFHDWIDDVQDLLPLDGIFEVPGNIGQGRRWGGKVDLTTTLKAIGLDNVRIETGAYVQESTVTDPVTGASRRLSNERPWNYSVELRQDFKQAGVAWGVGASDSAREEFFGLDEIVRVDEGVELSAFVETTRIRGVKVELRLGNLLNRNESRNRTVFSGARSLTPILFEENRGRLAGANAALVLSGAF